MDLYLLELIPFGHENAVTREELERLYSEDRDTRYEIKKLRAEYAILNMQDGKGYFRPTEDEGHLVERWIVTNDSRVRECERTADGARKWKQERESQALEGQVKLDGIS